MAIDCYSHKHTYIFGRCRGSWTRPNVAPMPSSRRRRLECCRTPSARNICVRAKAEDGSGEERALAPVRVKTAVGKMLDYYLKMEPHLFTAAIEKQLEHLKQDRDKKEVIDAEASAPASEDKSELVLYRRMNEVRKREQRATLEELMYVCVLEKFVSLGVQMMPRLDTLMEASAGTNIKALTEGIHSKEALEMVKEHVRMLMGQATLAYDSAIVRMPKLQAVQMYVTSIMFGYFVRRVDRRFQLERSAGMIGDKDDHEEAVNRLERLFSQANSMDMSDSPDSPTTSSSSNTSSGFQSDASSSNLNMGGGQRMAGKGALRQYVDTFGPDTVQEMARVVSQEAATLIEMQTMALFGDYRALQEQMEKAVGSNFISMAELMERVKKEMDSGAVDSVTLTVGTQRRAILEAIAFGTFLRDIESSIDSNYGLLTAAKVGNGGPGGDTPPGLAGAI